MKKYDRFQKNILKGKMMLIFEYQLFEEYHQIGTQLTLFDIIAKHFLSSEA